MSETERTEALKAIQLELFQLKREYALKTRELKRQLILIQGGGQKRCRDCDLLMDVEQFYPDNSRWDKRDVYCIECRSKRSSKAYAKRKANVIARGKAA